MSADFDSPPDVAKGERLELYEKHLAPHRPVFATVEGNVYGVVWVKVDGFSGVYPIDGNVTQWKRVIEAAPETMPAPKPPGAWCTGKHCKEYFEYANPSKNFLCYSCRNR